MSHDDLSNYRECLRHIVRPEDPAERAEADPIRLRDFEALYLYDGLVEYAAYEAPDGDMEQIALGLAEYINHVVRNDGKNIVPLYIHTDEAMEVLHGAADARSPGVEDLDTRIEERISVR